MKFFRLILAVMALAHCVNAEESADDFTEKMEIAFMKYFILRASEKDQDQRLNKENNPFIPLIKLSLANNDFLEENSNFRKLIFDSRVNRSEPPWFDHWQLYNIFFDKIRNSDGELKRKSAKLWMEFLITQKELPYPQYKWLIDHLLKDLSSPGYYDSEDVKALTRIIHRHERYSLSELLLLERLNEFSNPELLKSLEEIKEKVKSDYYRSYFLMVMLARHHYGQNLDQLLDIYRGLDLADPSGDYYLSNMMYLYLIRDPRMTEFLQECLRSEKKRFNGHDAMPNYSSVAQEAATALFLMLEGFPYTVDYKDYTDKDRQRHLQWFEANKQLVFREPEILFAQQFLFIENVEQLRKTRLPSGKH